MIKKIMVFFLAMLVSVVCDSTTFAKNDPTFIRRVRCIETEELGILNPAGWSFSYRANIFHLLDRRSPTPPSMDDILLLTPTEVLADSIRIAAEIKDPINMAFDNQANRLLIFKSAAKQLIEVLAGSDGNLNPRTLTRYNARHFGLQNPQGMTVDPQSGHLFILDATAHDLFGLSRSLMEVLKIQ